MIAAPLANKPAGTGYGPPVSSYVSAADRLTDAEPSVIAVALIPARQRAAGAGNVDGPYPTALFDELASVIERHFGDRVRIAAASPAPKLDPSLATPACLRFDRLRVDVARHEVQVDDRPVTLTKSEFDLLAILARRPGVVLSRREIVIASKGPNYPVDDRSIDVQMFNLRRKLGPLGRRLQTVRSVGYRFMPEND